MKMTLLLKAGGDLYFTRAADVEVSIPNKEGKLEANMLATVSINATKMPKMRWW